MSQVYDDRWQVIRPLSEGGQAHTFLVQEVGVSPPQTFVLKRLKNPKRVARFEREIEALEQLKSPNVVRMVAKCLVGDKPFLVTEYCEGGSLADIHPFPETIELSRAIEVFLGVCSGVLAAHNQSVLHRDIKPDNIFLRKPTGTPVVGDFGLCLLVDLPRLTETDEVIGPRFFIAPELENGRYDDATPACDVYSLGKLLHWLVSGLMFAREKHRDERWNIVNHNRLTSSLRHGPFLEHINRLLDKMIVEDPKKRISLQQAYDGALHALTLIEGRYNAISKDQRGLCIYCGIGQYRTLSRDEEGHLGPVYNGGLAVRLICVECGHVQIFLIDKAKRRHEWWSK